MTKKIVQVFFGSNEGKMGLKVDEWPQMVDEAVYDAYDRIREGDD